MGYKMLVDSVQSILGPPRNLYSLELSRNSFVIPEQPGYIGCKRERTEKKKNTT